MDGKSLARGPGEPKLPLPLRMEFIDLKSQQRRIRESLERRIAAVLDHGQYIMGPEIAELEGRLSEFVGCRHTIAVSSGTDSLLMALMALGVGPGDEVVTVSYTWISTAEVVALLGAKPVFVDIEPETWNMDPRHLREAITERTRAIIPVGIFGQTANMTEINRIAAEAGDLPVIEDAAQSFGATHHGKRSGSLSLVGSTSFFPSKPLGAYGDGGALFTDDDEFAEKLRWIRIHGQQRKHYHPVVGINGRLDTLQAAVVLAKLEIFEDEIRMRQTVAEGYASRLVGCPVQLPAVAEGNTSVFAQYTVLAGDREVLQAKLSAVGVPSVPYYAVPLHLQPVFEYLGLREGSLPVTERVASTGLSLPMSPYLTATDLDRIGSAVEGLNG